MAVKVAINGLAAIGRHLDDVWSRGSSCCNQRPSPEMLAYPLKYDSTQGNYSHDHKVEAATTPSSLAVTRLLFTRRQTLTALGASQR